MTAGEIVSNACKQAGFIEDGTTTSIVSSLGIGTLSISGGLTAAAGTVRATATDIGLAILNRWYLYAWQRFPHRDIKIANAVVSVAAGAVAVDLPAEIDVIRSVRIAGGALVPLSEVREVGKAALTSGTSTVLKQAGNAAGLTGTAAAEKAVEAATGSAWADGSCALK